jgi:hydroxymethylbilane synthase
MDEATPAGLIQSPLIRVGTRQSPLAMAQTRYVIHRLNACPAFETVEFEIVPILSTGDAFQNQSLQQLGTTRGGRFGLFVKELEQALLENRIDLAVHSLKDMASHIPETLTMLPVAPREAVCDAYLAFDGKTPFHKLPVGAIIGTSSVRRMAQLKKLRPDVQFKTLRGNIHTRLKKLESGEYAGIVLAEAGLRRMGLEGSITHTFCAEQELIPAVGQGVLAVELRQNFPLKQAIAECFQDAMLEACVRVERGVMKHLEGGCQLPLGCYAQALNATTLKLHIQLITPDGSQEVARTLELSTGSNADLDLQAQAIAEEILQAGGATIRESCLR